MPKSLRRDATRFRLPAANPVLRQVSALGQSRPDRVLAGLGWMILTTMLMATVTAIVRHVGSDLPAAQAGFIRYAAGAVIMLPFMGALLRQPSAERKLHVHALRGACHAAGVILWFYAMARIPIAEVTALGYIVPIFIILGAAIFLGEKLHARRLAAVAAGFVGALIILRPGFQEISLGQLAQVAAGPCYAASYLIAKRLTATASPTAIVGLLSVFCTLAIMPVALVQWVAPTFHQVAWLCLTAVFATAGHWTMTKAFESAPISVTQPVQFLQLVWATMFGIVLFGEPMDPFVILGGGIVLAAATFISHRESRAAGKAAAGRAAAGKAAASKAAAAAAADEPAEGSRSP